MEKWLRRQSYSAEDNFPSSRRLIQLAYIRLCGLILAMIGWVLCLTATGSDEWRVWHPKNVPGTSAGKISVGIWRVCIVRNPSEGEPTKRQCQEFLEQHSSLPAEIFIAQDLMSLASVVLSLALVCMCFALWNVFHNVRPEKVLLTFFRVGGVINLLSSLIILIPLLWNMYSVVVNERIMFPDDFRLPTLPYEQTIGFPIYVGVLASGFQLTSSIFTFSEKFRIRSHRVHPIFLVTLKPLTSSNDTESCPCCGSCISLDKLIFEKQLFNI